MAPCTSFERVNLHPVIHRHLRKIPAITQMPLVKSHKKAGLDARLKLTVQAVRFVQALFVPAAPVAAMRRRRIPSPGASSRNSQIGSMPVDRVLPMVQPTY